MTRGTILGTLGGDACNPLNTGFIFLFSGSVFVTNKIQIDRYS